MNQQCAARVLFVVPSLRHGGAEIQAVNLVNGLDTAEFEAHLLCYDSGDALQDRVDSRRVHVHTLQKKGRVDFAVIGATARLIDEHGIDIVHCTLQYSLFLAWLARTRAKRKPLLLCAIHTTVNRSWYEEFADRTVYRWLFRACRALIFVCRTQRDHWLRKYPELEQKSYVVFNGIDPGTFDPASAPDRARVREELGIPSDARLVACIAAFRPEKGHDLLLEAFSRVSRELPCSYLALAGDGPMRAKAEQLASKLGLMQRVRFVGPVNDVRGLLRASDVTVLASTAVETFSMAMLESMAMGVPLVATDMGGTKEAVIDGETGLIVAPHDVQSLEQALGALLGNKDYREELGRNARQLILKRFTEAGMIRDTEDILRDMLDNAPTPRWSA